MVSGGRESLPGAYIISATLETDRNGPVAIVGGGGTEEAAFVVWNGPRNGTMLRWNSVRPLGRFSPGYLV